MNREPILGHFPQSLRDAILAEHRQDLASVVEDLVSTHGISRSDGENMAVSWSWSWLVDELIGQRILSEKLVVAHRHLKPFLHSPMADADDTTPPPRPPSSVPRLPPRPTFPPNPDVSRPSSTSARLQAGAALLNGTAEDAAPIRVTVPGLEGERKIVLPSKYTCHVCGEARSTFKGKACDTCETGLAEVEKRRTSQVESVPGPTWTGKCPHPGCATQVTVHYRRFQGTTLCEPHYDQKRREEWLGYNPHDNPA